MVPNVWFTAALTTEPFVDLTENADLGPSQFTEAELLGLGPRNLHFVTRLSDKSENGRPSQVSGHEHPTCGKLHASFMLPSCLLGALENMAPL